MSPGTITSPPAAGSADRHRRRDLLLAGLIVTSAAYLRMQHLDAGIPYALGIDEPQIMERAVNMMKTGDFNPHFFDWPSLTIYLHMALACLTFLMGAMDGAWRHLDQVGPADMYANGRTLTAAFGTATIWLVYLIGSRWSRQYGLLAAALCAVIPYHVRESHYVLADVPTAFFTTLTLWLALRALERGTLWSFALSGAAAGLAASAKYNGMVALVVPLTVACLLAGSLADRARRIAAVGAAAGVAFLAGTPYALLDLPAFLNDYARLASIFARDRPGEPGWAIYLRHLELALGRPALVLTTVGLIVAAWRTLAGPHRPRWATLLLFPPLYFQVMAGSYQIYGRYLMPLLPFASLLAAAGVLALTTALARTRLRGAPARLVAVILVVATLTPPLLASVDFTRRLGQQSTVALTYAWIRDHVKGGATIVVEQHALQLPGDVYTVAYTASLIERAHADYAADSVDYLVASSEGYGPALAGLLSRDAYVAYQTLFTQAEQMTMFSPSDEMPGPEIRVLRIRRP